MLMCNSTMYHIFILVMSEFPTTTYDTILKNMLRAVSKLVLDYDLDYSNIKNIFSEFFIHTCITHAMILLLHVAFCLQNQE